jgi:U2 small nuclear ribonucleoprotein A'
MRINADLINQAPRFTNPLKERQLDLRGFKLAQIENLGATQVPRPSYLDFSTF